MGRKRFGLMDGRGRRGLMQGRQACKGFEALGCQRGLRGEGSRQPARPQTLPSLWAGARRKGTPALSRSALSFRDCPGESQDPRPLPMFKSSKEKPHENTGTHGAIVSRMLKPRPLSFLLTLGC